jgi:hypothetical protein
VLGRLGSAFVEKGDAFDDQRRRLKIALDSFRERVGQLITFIPRDMPGYTVHDLTHLDALWEMAGIIAGERFELNPAEAFVFGGAVLLHDAGMTTAAYVGAREEVERLPIYVSALNAVRAQLSSESTSGENEERARSLALVETLRVMHPIRAEQLATQAWMHPVDKNQLFLLDDSDLRSHYGSLIGRIAHSHHWEHLTLQQEFVTPFGAAPFMPPSWTVDPMRIALLLRCADAAHLDARRAPRLLFGLSNPSGISKDHWSFQSMLAKPIPYQGKLLYTSTSDFDLSKAGAWQLAFDTLKMVDGELRSADEINIQRGFERFSVDGVIGTGDASQLSRYVKAHGWRPLELNLQVSNVPHLARTLGGKDLYSFRLAPLRELIQNAADAIEARSAIDPEFSIDGGCIRVSIRDDGGDFFYLDVADNGIGMSERVITGPLLDFGFSFWRSAAARAEFPSLDSRSLHPRGRFGIGFFSVFMWAREVSVTSRRFFDGTAEASVLHFGEGLESRPLLRKVSESERSTKWSTRTSLRIPRAIGDDIFNREGGESVRTPYFSGREGPLYDNWFSAGKLLCGALKVPVELDFNGDVRKISCPEWTSISSEGLMSFFGEFLMDEDAGDIRGRFAEKMTNISHHGQVLGRAALMPIIERFPYGGSENCVLVYDRGIFAGINEQSGWFGIVEGVVTNAARESYDISSPGDNEVWLKEASDYAFSICRHKGEEAAVQYAMLEFKRYASDRPLFILGREIISPDVLWNIISHLPRLSIHLSEVTSLREGFALEQTKSLDSLYGLDVDENRLFSLVHFEGHVTKDSTVDEMMAGEGVLSELLRKIRDEFGFCSCTAKYVEQDGFKDDRIEVTFERD